jgi:hypothetical protein
MQLPENDRLLIAELAYGVAIPLVNCGGIPEPIQLPTDQFLIAEPAGGVDGPSVACGGVLEEGDPLQNLLTSFCKFSHDIKRDSLTRLRGCFDDSSV